MKFEDNVSIESPAVTFRNEVKNNDHNLSIDFCFTTFPAFLSQIFIEKIFEKRKKNTLGETRN